MADALIEYLCSDLPPEIASLTAQYIKFLEQGEYKSLLASTDTRQVLDQAPELQHIRLGDFPNWADFVFHRLATFCSDRNRHEKPIILFCIGYAALLAFVQSNVTGPPLDFRPSDLILPQSLADDAGSLRSVRSQLIASLGVDGIAAYKLTPNVELLCLADAVMTCPAVLKNVKAARWAKLRTTFLHQRLLSELSPTLQEIIYDDLALVEEDFRSYAGNRESLESELRLERVTIHIHHGLDKLARADLERAKQDRRFEFALTGMLGKRTKFQHKDTSQLVVLARSRDNDDAGDASSTTPASVRTAAESTKPANFDLNDDTLLDSIAFSRNTGVGPSLNEAESLPPSLKALDPSNQPRLQPLDSVILLSLVSSITNTNPENGLTREETLPYATRVLDGGSSNWQVYTQALLVRSRIEGHSSRTIERGLLQLQALVDQIVADTTGEDSARSVDSTATFLPQGRESAPVTERIRYVFQLAAPTRAELETELANRWVQLGGLRSALDIFERLELWAEAALCWAATEREDKARRILRQQLFHATNGGPDIPEDEAAANEDENWTGPARDPPPLDAPRLYCILGDIDRSVEMYEQAWEVSGKRYSRAQRSLGRLHFAAQDHVRAAEAYSRSLQVNHLHHQSWFALGCALLELAQFEKAVEAFSRCVQLDDTDAEAWSNLAAALLRSDPDTVRARQGDDDDDGDGDDDKSPALGSDRKQVLRRDALRALQRAASLKHDSYRIWENVLIVSASLSPPEYMTMLSAQRRIVELRAASEGEKCLDLVVIASLVDHAIASAETYDPSIPGFARLAVAFVDEHVVPLITSSAQLWHVVSRLALWRQNPRAALDAEEKAWRAVTSQPGWEADDEAGWNEVVEASLRLCDAYASLGPRERTDGLAADSGQLVASDWKFKARTALRSVMGRAKEAREGSTDWERLREGMDGLRG